MSYPCPGKSKLLIKIELFIEQKAESIFRYTFNILECACLGYNWYLVSGLAILKEFLSK